MCGCPSDAADIDTSCTGDPGARVCVSVCVTLRACVWKRTGAGRRLNRRFPRGGCWCVCACACVCVHVCVRLFKCVWLCVCV